VNTKLYDLSNIKSELANDTDAVNEMIWVFLEFTPDNLEELNNAYKASDYTRLVQSAHKIKYSIISYGIKSLENDIKTLEELARQKADLKLMSPLISKVNQVLQSVSADIRNELTKENNN